MLEELIVRNLGLLEEAHIEPGTGLVVISGETGTGKTMLLGGVELLAGRTASPDLVGPAGDEASVQGRFSVESHVDEVVAARRVVVGGRSRAYLDGDMVPARLLSDRIEPHLDIVKQGDVRRLADPAAFQKLVDGCLDRQGQESRGEYQSDWAAVTQLHADQDSLGGDTRALERELEMARHQLEEINGAGFEPGDDEELEVRAERLRHAGDLADSLEQAAGHLDHEEHLAAAVDALRRAAGFDRTLRDLSVRLDGLQAEWADAASEIRSAAASIEHDPRALHEVEARLTTLGTLKRKYGEDLEAVLAFADEASRRAAEAESLLSRAGELDAELDRATRRLETSGEALRAARVRAGKSLATDAIAHLQDLGFSAPRVEVVVEPAPPGPSGADRVKLLFASDEALEPVPAHKAASGGEMSRLILAIRLAAGASDADIMVFDEVDAGVGGATALAMGRKLADLARGRQVFCVTHLPQVAAHAATHYVVDRQGNRAFVRPVVNDERLAELTRMMAGLGESAAGREHAVELLEIAKAANG